MESRSVVTETLTNLPVAGRNAFAPGVTDKIGYYVYLLIDPRDNAVFYVGKGMGDRCFSHIAEARKTKADTVGDYAKLARIREVEKTETSVRIDILRHGLCEHEAFLIESTAMDLLLGLTNRTGGHGSELGRMPVSEINALYGATPVTIDSSHRVVLIRINQLFERSLSDSELYEATRKWWRVSQLRRQVDNEWSPEWAMAVFGGVVRAVYRIEAWEQPTQEDLNVDANRAKRWAFRGKRDQIMEEKYLHRDIWSYLRDSETGRASQNPVRYVNCNGPMHEVEQSGKIVTIDVTAESEEE